MLASFTSVARATPVNLLANPGGESGTASPWEVDSIFGASASPSVANGPVVVAGQTLQATEGTHWFAADGTSSDANASWSGYIRGVQRVDIRGLGAAYLRYSGDGFGVGQVISGSGSLSLSHTVGLVFYSETDYLSDSFAFSEYEDITGKKATFLGTSDVAAVPEGAAFVDFYELTTIVPWSGSGFTWRIASGVDNAVLEVVSAPVPEPSAWRLVCGGLAAGGLAIRRRRRWA